MQILHIGTEKTGTTHLQNFLANNAEVFMEKYGINVRSPKGLGGSSSDLVNLVADKSFPDLPKATGDLVEHEFIYDSQIISSEHFSSRLTNENELLRLKELVNKDNKPGKIILYLKPQCELLVGMFAEAVKAGQKVVNLPTIEEIFSRSRYGYLYFDYVKLIELWKAVFFDYELKAIAYNRNNFPEGDICRSFLEESFGIYSSEHFNFPSFNTNKTLSPEMLMSLDDFQSVLPNIARHRLVKLLELHDPFGKGTFIDRKAFEWLKKNTKGSNSKLKMDFGLSIDNNYESFRFIDKSYSLPSDIFNEILAKIKESNK